LYFPCNLFVYDANISFFSQVHLHKLPLILEANGFHSSLSIFLINQILKAKHLKGKIDKIILIYKRKLLLDKIRKQI